VKLRTWLKRSESQATFNEVEWATIKEIRAVHQVLLVGIHGLLSICVMLAATVMPTHNLRGSLGIAIVTDCGMLYFYFSMHRRYKEYWRENTPEGRTSLIAEAEKLEQLAN
jgi:hypothetical protein